MNESGKIFVVDCYGIKEAVIRKDLGDYYIISFVKDNVPESTTWSCSKKYIAPSFEEARKLRERFMEESFDNFKKIYCSSDSIEDFLRDILDEILEDFDFEFRQKAFNFIKQKYLDKLGGYEK